MPRRQAAQASWLVWETGMVLECHLQTRCCCWQQAMATATARARQPVTRRETPRALLLAQVLLAQASMLVLVLGKVLVLVCTEPPPACPKTSCCTKHAWHWYFLLRGKHHQRRPAG